MQRAISAILSGIVLSTLIATSAIATEQPSTANMTVNEAQTVDLERAYVDKHGS
ncbi:MAG: hypothetical protein NW224_16900 [Leptolyngbyaceae cyanobacterium bins.302]|nr:hypothetical protein [Leptolyngbyaceae cyanobacterium bins.302]